MSAIAAQEAIQARIAAAEAYAAIDYGIRSINESRSAYGASACHAAQIAAACAAAEGLTGEWISQDKATRRKLAAAKKIALDAKREAEAAIKAIGDARQIRLAIAA